MYFTIRGQGHEPIIINHIAFLRAYIGEENPGKNACVGNYVTNNMELVNSYHCKITIQNQIVTLCVVKAWTSVSPMLLPLDRLFFEESGCTS